MPKKILASTDRGDAKVDVGWKKNGTGFIQHRFYLGGDKTEAAIRKARLVQLWEFVEARWKRDHPFTPTAGPVWDDTTLHIAKAVAKGQTKIAVPVPTELPEDMDSPIIITSWLRDLQDDLPNVQLVLEDSEFQKRGDDYWQERGKEQLESAKKTLRIKRSSLTLHKALDQFGEWIKKQKKFTDVETGILKPSAKKELRYIRLHKKHLDDMALDKLGGNAIDTIEDYWAGRPKSKKGELFAIHTSRDVIKMFRRFIRWMHKAETIDWRKPSDYEVRYMKIEPTQAELAARATPEQVKRYKLKEIEILWRYATPWERLLLLLGLNCGFGRAEINTLFRSEVQGNFIKRIRRKTKVYGEWRLWEITKKAIDWYITHRRGNHNVPELILTKTGMPLSKPTKGSNPKGAISNAWYSLLNRIGVDHAEFRKGGRLRLSFNKLRKTAGNIVRRLTDGETMKVFHARGKPVAGDEHSEVYSNKNFSRVHWAIRRIEKKLAPTFATVPDPFPVEVTKTHVSLATIARMKTLKQQGFKITKIAEIVGLTDETVRKYTKETEDGNSNSSSHA